MYLTPLAEGTVWTLALFFCSAFLAVALGLWSASSLVAMISVYELMRAGEMLAGATFQALTVYTMVGVIYFVLCSVLAYLFRRSENG